MTAYFGLFLSALVAGTMPPMQSEVVLAGLLALGALHRRPADGDCRRAP